MKTAPDVTIDGKPLTETQVQILRACVGVIIAMTGRHETESAARLREISAMLAGEYEESGVLRVHAHDRGE